MPLSGNKIVPTIGSLIIDEQPVSRADNISTAIQYSFDPDNSSPILEEETQIKYPLISPLNPLLIAVVIELLGLLSVQSLGPDQP